MIILPDNTRNQNEFSSKNISQQEQTEVVDSLVRMTEERERGMTEERERGIKGEGREEGRKGVG